MNNKGFAITSVIYGLSILGIMIVMILMGTLSSTRNNVSEEAKMVEEFLIAFNQTTVTYRAQGNYVYTVPRRETGWYRIEAFGPMGCGATGANGSYTTGIIFLQEGEALTLNIGSCNGNTVVKKGEDVLMRAPGGNNATPGGTTLCYSSTPLGGEIDMNTFQLINSSKSLIGNDAVNFSACTDSNRTAYIRGYPASGTGEWNDFFVDGLMLGASYNSTSGKVIIERLAERDNETIMTIPRKNTFFDNITSIKIESTHTIDSVYYSYQIPDGDKFKGTVVKCGSNTNCTVPNVNIDDISVLFDSGEYHKNLNNVRIKLNDRVVYDSYRTDGIGATPIGIHLSAYQPNTYDSDLNSANNDFAKHGNYYMIPVVSEGKVISAAQSAADDADKLKIEYITGDSRQKWAIDLLNVPGNSYKMFQNINNASSRYEYRIVELTRYKAMSIYYDENYKTNFISAPETFNSLSRNEPQIWNIYPMGDGTCAIKTVVESFDTYNKSGFLFAKTRGLSVNNIDEIMIGGVANNPTYDYQSMPTSTERFILYSLDFSS